MLSLFADDSLAVRRTNPRSASGPACRRRQFRDHLTVERIPGHARRAQRLQLQNVGPHDLSRRPGPGNTLGDSRRSPLLGLILLLTASNLLESFTIAALVVRRNPGLRFVPRQIDRQTVRMIGGFSLNSFVAMIAGRFTFSTDAS